MLGVSWPDAHVAFPDFGAEETINWWIDEITTFYKIVTIFFSLFSCIRNYANLVTVHMRSSYSKLVMLECHKINFMMQVITNNARYSAPYYEIL